MNDKHRVFLERIAGREELWDRDAVLAIQALEMERVAIALERISEMLPALLWAAASRSPLVLKQAPSHADE